MCTEGIWSGAFCEEGLCAAAETQVSDAVRIKILAHKFVYIYRLPKRHHIQIQQLLRDLRRNRNGQVCYTT